MNDQLKVVWIPDVSKSVSGEVKNKRIYIYEESEKKALDTLRHEIVDYYVCQAIEPYKKVTNTLIRLISEDAYKQKEKIIEILVRLLVKTG